MADLRQATSPFAGVVAGRRVLVRAGDLFAADDLTVKAFPGKFREPLLRSTQPAPVRATKPKRKAKPAAKKG